MQNRISVWLEGYLYSTQNVYNYVQVHLTWKLLTSFEESQRGFLLKTDTYQTEEITNKVTPLI